VAKKQNLKKAISGVQGKMGGRRDKGDGIKKE